MIKLLENPKLKINVNMTGKEYMDYKASRKIKLSIKEREAILILIFVAIGILGIIVLFSDLSPEPEVKTYAEKIVENYHVASLNWNQIGKILVIVFAPWLVIGIVIAWVIHGFGFIIIRG